jgi:diadenylate cyclase
VSWLDHVRLFEPGSRDLIQILIVAYVFYRLLLLIHGTRAIQMLLGVVVLVIVYAVAWIAKLAMLTYLLGIVFTYGAFAALVVFQPELRSALAHLGRSRFTRFFRSLQERETAEEIAEAAGRLSRRRVGAIIAVERERVLGDYAASGTSIEAKVSADLLATIFTPYSPLHDGAVIIRDDRIISAGCILPLTQKTLRDRALGTRHRAALGLAEETDAVVVVVSEETATISVAHLGRLTRNVSVNQLRELLAGRIAPDALEPELTEASA